MALSTYCHTMFQCLWQEEKIRTTFLTAYNKHWMKWALHCTNARVGSRNSAEIGEWGDTRGPHGQGQLNYAGRELLNFLSLNKATVCNTWFRKKSIYKHTWQHPKSKRWHCIDFSIMWRRDLKKCLDSSVKRGAECKTDHNLLHIRVRLSKFCQPSESQLARTDLMSPSCLIHVRGEHCQRTLQKLVSNTVKETWKVDSSLEDKWNTLKTALVDAAKTTVGIEKHKHPNWFRENMMVLELLFKKRNQLYIRWLGSGLSRDKEKF